MTAAPHIAPQGHRSLKRLLPGPRVRPLWVRPGARYECFGDGLCCSDIHALGPVTRAEKKAVELIAPGTLVRHKDLLAPVFRTQSAGACVLRSARGCELHARFGAEAKPGGCARFPFGLIATPEGGRITTEHRCPCRTMGQRPLLSTEAAYSSLVDGAGRLAPNGRAGPRVRISATQVVSFARYRAVEEPMLEGLVAGRPAVEVLGVKPFARLQKQHFRRIAEAMQEERDGTAYGAAMVWVGSALSAVLTDAQLALSPRPWSSAFDRAEARSPQRETAQQVLNDWLADLLWSLDWVFVTSSFEAGKRELATAFAIAERIARRLVRARVRADRAAAEAVMMVEVARQSAPWERVQMAL